MLQCTCGDGVHAFCGAHMEKVHACCSAHVERVHACTEHTWRRHMLHACSCAHVEIKGQFAGVHSPLTSCGSWEANLGYQPWSQVPVPTDPSLSGLRDLNIQVKS